MFAATEKQLTFGLRNVSPACFQPEAHLLDINPKLFDINHERK
jgi:hypothetical protein